MIKKAFLAGQILLLSFSALALETDNYITWNMELKDSAEDINAFISREINTALDKANNKRKIQSCRAVTFQIAKRFKASPVIFKHPMEDWIRESLSEEQVFPKTDKWIKQSIYRYPYRFYLKAMPVAPNVQIGGFYLGTDKLSHFTSTGRRYLSHYLKKIKHGWTDDEAQKSAIRFGLANEATVLGTWSSGVFSYGDMEANYQGFLFYKKMCMNESDNYLEQDEEGTWKLVKSPEMRDFVSAYWDETFNLSYRKYANWVQTAPVIKDLYCGESILSFGKKRLDKYKLSPFTSYSLDYIKELQDEDYYRAPKPLEEQSFTELCQTPPGQELK
ncbi:MAG TPA: hypothetical protein VNJ08_04035 [Bacteriovoracaceae bacterium]|nr:hypothetical protein [Bacteriovoracaceae bacterium]